VMTFALTFAGAVQVYHQRILGESYMDVQDTLALFYWIRLASGVFVLFSALMFLWALFVPGKERAADGKRTVADWTGGTVDTPR
jgi:nitric oxide reductase subunit B